MLEKGKFCYKWYQFSTFKLLAVHIIVATSFVLHLVYMHGADVLHHWRCIMDQILLQFLEYKLTIVFSLVGISEQYPN